MVAGQRAGRLGESRAVGDQVAGDQRMLVPRLAFFMMMAVKRVFHLVDMRIGRRLMMCAREVEREAGHPDPRKQQPPQGQESRNRPRATHLVMLCRPIIAAQCPAAACGG